MRSPSAVEWSATGDGLDERRESEFSDAVCTLLGNETDMEMVSSSDDENSSIAAAV